MPAAKLSFGRTIVKEQERFELTYNIFMKSKELNRGSLNRKGRSCTVKGDCEVKR